MLVLTLVHGTWGRGVFYPSGDAEWTKDDSLLCNILKGRCGSDVKFRRFHWSGGNSHTARLKAAEKLSEYLRQGIKESPGDAKHIIVAHSHGGNVALLALKDFEQHERISGVACLATPFISAKMRDIGRDPIRTFSMALLVLFFVFYWLVDNVLSHWTDETRVAVKVLGGSILAMIGLVLEAATREYAEKLFNILTPFLPRKEQLLIVRSPADEAIGLLSIFQFISQLTVRLFLVAQSWSARIEES